MRQREAFGGDRLCDRERAGRMAQVRVGGREVRRLRIVPARRDPARGQELRQLLGLARPDHVQVPDRVAALRDRRERAGRRCRRARAVVEARRAATRVVPRVEVRQLVAEHDRLQGVHAGGEAGGHVPVLLGLAVLAKRAHAVGELEVVGDERARVAHRAEILRGVEAERRGVAPGAGAQAVAVGAVRLARVLEHPQPVASARSARARACPPSARRGAPASGTACRGVTAAAAASGSRL